ncbi:SDR family NAD(P)-dependent oxidoreductase [Dongia mobilis]|uniref:SDR family NAD(P)-dependent oxidoreductase n=1 Tax=Dongia sp. TaxID=1977262 RepID=UPI0026EED5F1
MTSTSILITGAGSGIGAATAQALAGPGRQMLLHTKSNRAGLESIAAEVEARGSRTVLALGDLADAATGSRLVEAAVAAFGGLEILVSNAGFPLRPLIGMLTRDELDHAYAVIAGGFFALTSAALPHLRAAGPRGRVVAISTHNAHLFLPGYLNFPASAAAKAALETMVKSLALQLAPDGVTVNAIAPGLIAKDKESGEQTLSPEEWQRLKARIPMGELGSPSDVAATAAFLCSPAARYMTGQILHVDGGLVIR